MELVQINDRIWISLKHVTAVTFGECNDHLGQRYTGGDRVGELMDDQESRQRLQIFDDTTGWASIGNEILTGFWEVSPECMEDIVVKLVHEFECPNLLRIDTLTWVDPKQIYAIHWAHDCDDCCDESSRELRIFHANALRNPCFPDKDGFWVVGQKYLPSVWLNLRLPTSRPRKKVDLREPFDKLAFVEAIEKREFKDLSF